MAKNTDTKSSITSIEEKLNSLYKLQIIDSNIDKIRIVRGELPLEIEDLEILKKWRNDSINRNHTREYRLLNMINQKEWFEMIHKDNPPKFLMFGVTDKRQKLIGVCGLTYIDWKNRHCEISIILYLKNWQKTKQGKEII